MYVRALILTLRSLVLCLSMLLCVTAEAQQRVSVRNNLLYDAMLTPNIGADVMLNHRWSLGMTAGYRPWPTSDNVSRKWRHVLLMPELRHWSDSTFADRSWFWGINAAWSHYNMADVGFPIGTVYPAVKHERRQGDLVAVGASIGRSWRLNQWLRLEAEAGIDVGYTKGDIYECGRCGSLTGDYKRLFLVPKLALNLVLNRHKRPVPVVDVHPVDTLLPPPPPAPPVLVFHRVPDYAGRAGLLEKDNPVLKHISQYRPYDRTRILRKESGALYVNFPLDRSLLQREYRENAPTLDHIVDITRQIMADSTSSVKRIQIVGLASIEGAVAHNEQLSQQRAEALKAYIQQHVANVPDSLFELNGGGEAWADLRDQLCDVLAALEGETTAPSGKTTAPDGKTTAPGGKTTAPGGKTAGHGSVVGGLPADAPSADAPSAEALRQAIAVIDGESDAARREQRLRQLNGGRTYQYISQQLLPDQRNSGYLRIYYDYVPDKTAAVINRASELLSQERYQEALQMLQTVASDPRAQNALGVALFYNNHMGDAIECFERAANAGNADAKENLIQMYRQLER